MHYSTSDRRSTPADCAPGLLRRNLLRAALLPVAVLGVGLWLAPRDAAAAPRCSSKPAVCARIANERKARPPVAPVMVNGPAAPVALARHAPARCSSKPIVCARFEAHGPLRAPQPPVTLARDAAAGDRCTSKPAVCARLKLKPKAPPMTLASDELR